MISSRGIVLGSVRFSDEKVVANVYTEREGTVGFVVRRTSSAAGGSRRGRGSTGARVKAAVWQPLTVVDIVWKSSPTGGLAVPQEVGVARPWRDIPFHPHKTAIALFLGEFLERALRHEQGSPGLLAYVEGALSWLDAAREGFANFHIVFLLGLSRHLGFEPNAEGWQAGAFFDLRAAEFTLERPLHPDFLEGEEAALVPRFMRLGFAHMRLVRLTGAARNRMLQVIVSFYRLHVAELPEMKSLAVLGEVMRA